MEHVPPKCIFPKRDKFRKNLITVPSCDEHNSKKSKDDELLRHILSSTPGCNELALEIIEHGVMPSFDRRPHIIDTFVPDIAPAQFNEEESATFSVDGERFESSIEAIVRGIFYHEFGKTLTAKLRIAWGVLIYDEKIAPYFKLIQNAESQIHGGYKGDNPRVFQYSIQYSESRTKRLCRMRFYEGHPIYAIWNPKGLIL
jgi:hypothetical protein